MIRQRNRLEKYPNQMPEKLLMLFLVIEPLIGIVCLGFGLLMFPSDIGTAIFLIPLGITGLVYSWSDYQAAMAEYSFSTEGVMVRFPMEKQWQYSWNDFQKVCVCYHSRATEMYGYSIICLVKKGEKKDVFGRWKTANSLRYRSVICLDYSDVLLETIRKNCPYDVPDLRNKGNYRI